MNLMQDIVDFEEFLSKCLDENISYFDRKMYFFILKSHTS